MRPLADEIRPQTLDEVVGQKHLLGEGALLRRLIESARSIAGTVSSAVSALNSKTVLRERRAL